LIDTSSDDNQVYYFDHEDCAESLEDESVLIYTLEEVISDDLVI